MATPSQRTDDEPSSPTGPVLTDEPRFSSAALCIRLKHLGRTFRPEFTHQCTENESWPGCRPLQAALAEATEQLTTANHDGVSSPPTEAKGCPSGRLLHKSHLGHELATSELDVHVVLSPSCRLCHVNIRRVPVPPTSITNGLPPTGATATTTPPSFEDRGVSGGKENEERDSKRAKRDGPASAGPTPKLAPVCDPSGNAAVYAPPCLSNAEILQKLRNGLPDVLTDSETVEGDFLTEPLGLVLEEFSIPPASADDKGRNFVVTIADGQSPDVASYHSSVQRLALLYIENADDVDVSATDNGFWKVMYIFEKQGGEAPIGCSASPRYSLVGYFTLFHFIALFHKPEPGLIVRICQALVLPSHQGQGHGRRLMQAVHDVAHGGRYDAGAIYRGNNGATRNVVLVNVEDPAPGFAALRNGTDLALVRNRGGGWDWPGGCVLTAAGRAAESESFFSTLTEQTVLDLSAKAKIVPRQVHIVNELLKLGAVLDHRRGGERTPDEQEEIEKKFRLLVKRRLNKELREELGSLSTKDEKKALLADAFEAELKSHRRLVIGEMKRELT